VCGGNNFVFNGFVYLDPMRSKNMVKIGGPGSCNNSANKSIRTPFNKQLEVEMLLLRYFASISGLSLLFVVPVKH